MSDQDSLPPCEKNTVIALIPEIITSPNTAIDRIWRHGAPWWLPLIIVSISIGLAWVLYYSQVNYDWLIHYNTSLLDPESREQAVMGMKGMSARGLAGMTVGGIVVMLLIFSFISALYLLLINRVTGTTPRTYKEWLSISTWMSLPTVFIGMGAILNVLLSESSELPPEMLSLTNVNALIFHASKGEPLFNFYSSLDLINFWSIALVAMALIKNGQSRIAAVIISLVPQVIILSFVLF